MGQTGGACQGRRDENRGEHQRGLVREADESADEPRVDAGDKGQEESEGGAHTIRRIEQPISDASTAAQMPLTSRSFATDTLPYAESEIDGSPRRQPERLAHTVGMRRWWGVGLGLFALALRGCGGGGGDGILSFGVDIDIDQTTVPGFADPPLSSCELEPSGTLDSAFGEFTVDFSEEEEFQGHGPFELREVVLERIVLTIVDEADGDTDDFDFVDSIRIFADDPDDPEPRRMVAELDPVPDGVKEIVIPGTGVDIADLAAADEFVGQIEATGRPPCDAVNFIGVAEFDVTVF
jgi:hypothetical protein